MNYLLVIPARMQSSRLPGKPLIDLAGRSMLMRTCDQCLKAVPKEKIIVATDHEDIVSHCQENGINVMMTSSKCLTGTDRVAEVATKTSADVYINVQGDEPIMDPKDIERTIEAAQKNPDDIINGYTEIDEHEFRSRSIPKVLIAPDGSLLYTSRSPVPGNKKDEFIQAYRQVCVYAFPRKSLQLFTSRTTKTPLEQIEDLEMLRFLEMGVKVKMIELSSNSIAVDTPEDADKVRKLLTARNAD